MLRGRDRGPHPRHFRPQRAAGVLRRPLARDNELQEFYDGLLPETRALMDEFIEFARAKDEKARRQRQDEQDRKYDDLCRYYQRMFYETAYEGTRFGELVAFSTPKEERSAFESFLSEQAAAKRKPGIDQHCEGLEEELRDGYLDADGTEKHWSEDEIQSMLADERSRMDEEYGKKDEEVIARVSNTARYDSSRKKSWPESAATPTGRVQPSSA